MRFGGSTAVLAVVAVLAQVGCTIGAPAMNDSSGPSPIVPQISVAHRTSLPTCTPARDDLRAYIRDEKLVATCDGADWLDESGNSVSATPASAEGTPSAELPAADSGTIEQL